MPPLHPVSVHFPLALLPLGLALEIATRVTRLEQFSRVGWWVQLLGTAGLLTATISGLLAQAALPSLMDATRSALDVHQQLAFAADVLFAILLFWRIGSRTRIPTRRTTAFLVLYASAVMFLFAVGLYGGDLVFGFGVGVGR
jgi:uncharacterized membrane protein